jgi:hypothetical protein
MGAFSKVDQRLIKVANGQIDGLGHQVRHVFGYNADVDAAAEETVWTYGGIYTHLASPTLLTISSSSSNDTAAGTGARTVLFTGINGDGTERTETLTLNGQTAVTTTYEYTEVQSMTVVSAGSGEKNAGQIYLGTGTVTSGVPANVYGHIAVGENQSLMGHITVPLGYTGYLVAGSVSTGATQAGKNITCRLKYRYGGVTYTSAIVNLASDTAEFNFKYPIELPAGACITATAKSSIDNESVSSYFQVLLVKE